MAGGMAGGMAVVKLPSLSSVSSAEGSVSSEETGSESPGLELLCQAAVAGVGDEKEKGDTQLPKGKRAWTKAEDVLLRSLVEKHGPNRWTLIAKNIPGRTGKQARERWLNQLDPELKRKGWTAEEDQTIIRAHAQYGNKWSLIASQLKGRTDNSIKNRFNSTLKRRLQRQQNSSMGYPRHVSPSGYYKLPPYEVRPAYNIVPIYPRHEVPVYQHHAYVPRSAHPTASGYFYPMSYE